MRFFTGAVLLVCGLTFSVVRSAEPSGTANDGGRNWAQWRGPSGQGYVQDNRVPLAWSASQNLLWKTALPGKGNSTPVVWGDRLFLTASSSNGDERYVLCLRTGDGQLLWRQTASTGVEPGQTHKLNGFASASCVTDSSHVYAFFGTPGLFCYDFEGKLIWNRTFGVFTSDWGTGASPVVFEDLVIQNCDDTGAAGLPPGRKPAEAAPADLVALDKRTGKEIWRAPRNQGKGWSTPVLIPMPGGRVDLVLNGPHGVCSYDPRTGKEMWRCDRHKGETTAMFGEPISVFDRDKLVMLSGRPGPTMAVRLGGAGDVTRTRVLWDVPRKGSRDIGSPILWNGLLFQGDYQAFISCIDAQGGALVYKERAGTRTFSASPVLIQGKMLFLAEDGQTYIVEPGRQFKVIGKNVLGDGSEFRASPAVADGRMFLRSQTNLYCIGKTNGRAGIAAGGRDSGR